MPGFPKRNSKGRTEVIVIRLTSEEKAAWQAYAATIEKDNQRGRLANIIRRAVDLYIKADGAKKDRKILWTY
jgi:hypothetical protein